EAAAAARRGMMLLLLVGAVQVLMALAADPALEGVVFVFTVLVLWAALVWVGATIAEHRMAPPRATGFRVALGDPRADAEWAPPAECGVAVRVRSQGGAIRAVELRGGAVRRADERDDLLAPANPRPADLDVLDRDATGELHRAVVAQQLLAAALQQPRVAAQPLQLARVLEQRQHPPGDQVHGRLVAGDQEQHE